MEQSCRQFCPGTAQGMAQGNGTAIDIDDIGIEAKFLDNGQCLGCKGFVKLDEVDIVELHIGHFQNRRNCGNGTDPHNLRAERP